ncbi:MAG: CPBP family intramembrane metalloprotease [Oscillospiraceae bacterium]|nr:CPBP family intramembrane metalloprotease [Oscillospiraceae bacterium]
MEPHVDMSSSKRVFCRIGLALAVIFVLSNLSGYLLGLLIESVPAVGTFLRKNGWAEWIINMLPLYLFAIPPGLLILKNLPAKAPRDMALKAKYLLEYIPICMFIMYSGSLIGTILSFVLSGGTATNPVEDYLKDQSILKIISVVVLAPLVEEFLFRKTIIDHTVRYGEKWAVLLSAVTFGLLHQNFFQFFYAAGLGALLAYVYVRTGRLRYSVFLHSFVNFLGGVIAPWLLKGVERMQDPSSLTPMGVLALLGVLMYSMVLIGMYIFGLIRTVIRCKQLLWIPGEEELPHGVGFRTVFVNRGVILFAVLCVVAMVLTAVFY